MSAPGGAGPLAGRNLGRRTATTPADITRTACLPTHDDWTALPRGDSPLPTSPSRCCRVLAPALAVLLVLLLLLATAAGTVAHFGPRLGLKSTPWQWQRRRPVTPSVLLTPAAFANLTASCAPLAALPAECDGHRYNVADGVLSLRHGLAGRNAWGNDLSPYWQARGIAHLAGLAYQSAPELWRTGIQMHHYWYTPDAWLGYLPTHVARHSCPDLPRLKQACTDCRDWSFPHMCSGAWTAIVPAIRHDTHAAFEAWAAHHGKSVPSFEAHDVIIQFRCEPRTVLYHPHYGPIAYSFYAALPNTTRAIALLRDPRGEGDSLCDGLFMDLHFHLSNAHRQAQVSSADAGELWQAWARMIYTPTFYKAASSLGLWAGVANRGVTHSVPLVMSAGHVPTTPDLGPGWVWERSQTLFPHVGAAANLSRSRLGGILHWLEEH